MARLIRQHEGQAPAAIEMAGELIRIGRVPGNEIEVIDALVSRKHAEIKREGDQWVLYDLDSMNGTFINGQRISKQVLRPGDNIGIGADTFLFDPEGSLAAPGAAGAAPPKKGPGSTGSSQEIVKSLQELEADISEVDKGVLSGGTDMGGGAYDRERHFYVLYQVGRVINASTELNDLLRSVTQLLFEAINAERAGIFLLNAEEEPELKISHFRDSTETEELKVSRTILNKVIGEKVGILTSDAKYDPRFEAGQSIAAFGIRSALCVPLWDRNRVCGAIYMDNKAETYAFGEEDMDLLGAIANQLAIGILNVSLTEQLKLEAVRRSNLEMYHSPDVVEMLMQQSEENERSALGVREAEATILFSDICGFTSMSTRFTPSEIAFILNGYFEEMTRVIFRHKGSVNKFIGDAIMAIYGAPVQHQNDAALAVQSAIEQIQALQDYLAKLDESKHFRIRIGINTGPVVVGNIGSSTRLEYTVLGDTVNTAQRLESVAPQNGVLIGERTKKLVDGLFKVKDVGLLKLKGKDPTRAYEVIF